VYHGSSSGLASAATWTADADQQYAFFGSSVASAGDVDGDGYGDVVIGAPQFDGGLADEGRAYVYLGSATGLATSADWTAESDQAFSSFGSAVASSGDVNGDGLGDVVVGAFTYDDPGSNEGSVFVYEGQ
jgi:hypothetical protein